MKNTIFILIGIFIFSIANLSCGKLDIKVDVPNCIENKIRINKKRLVQDPAVSVWQWKVDGKTYYHFLTDCCDRLNYLYDNKCKLVCSPDGGFSGKGNEDCPQFFGEIERTLIWEADRE